MIEMDEIALIRRHYGDFTGLYDPSQAVAHVKTLLDLMGMGPKRTVDPDEWDRTKRAYWAKMSRADRLSNGRFLDGLSDVKPMACNDGEDHRWTPLSFRFEAQLLDGEGRVRIRQPAIDDAHVYLLCMGCRTWTYVVAEWAGYYLGGPGEGFAGPDPVLGRFEPEQEAEDEQEEGEGERSHD